MCIGDIHKERGSAMSLDNSENKKKKDLVAAIPNWGWLLISLLTAMALWFWLSVNPSTSRSFPFIPKVLNSLKTMIERGVLWNDFSSCLLYTSIVSVIQGLLILLVSCQYIINYGLNRMGRKRKTYE